MATIQDLQLQQNSSMQTSITEIESQRAMQEVQAAMAIAQRFPRKPVKAWERVELACSRPALAENAMYDYSRGGTQITGPSVTLMRAIATAWGNLQFGFQELSQIPGMSVVEAVAWDLETNTRSSKIVYVPHVRHTKSGDYPLTDPRDIYEMVSNMAARRLRTCLEDLIPGELVEHALSVCQRTLSASADCSPEGQANLLEAFEEFGVTKAQIEKRIQRRVDAITPPLVVGLKRIYVSLREKMSTPDEWFPPETSIADTQEEGAEDEVWPKKEIDPETGEENWMDASGDIFDHDKHAMGPNGTPSMKRDGTFRARSLRGSKKAQAKPGRPRKSREQIEERKMNVQENEPTLQTRGEDTDQGFGEWE